MPLFIYMKVIQSTTTFFSVNPVSDIPVPYPCALYYCFQIAHDVRARTHTYAIICRCMIFVFLFCWIENRKRDKCAQEGTTEFRWRRADHRGINLYMAPWQFLAYTQTNNRDKKKKTAVEMKRKESQRNNIRVEENKKI